MYPWLFFNNLYIHYIKGINEDIIADIEVNITIVKTINLNNFSFIDSIIFTEIKNGMIIAGNNLMFNTMVS